MPATALLLLSLPTPPTPARPTRWPHAALLACAVLWLHASALRGLTTASAPGPRLPAPGAMQVRQITPVVPTEPPPRAGVTGAYLPAQASPPDGADVRPAPAKAAAPPAPTSASGPPLEAAPAAQAPPPTAPGTPVPTYATQPAPAVTLVYEMQRGERSGWAELRWRPGAARYELELDASGFGPQAPGSASTGAFDVAGLAPERHVDRRRGRDQRAVNFQREGGFISFSGPQLTHTLQPGAQDRLSWMLQLPAIIDADPAAWPPGRELALFVAGTRGDAAIWSFTVIDRETTELPDGTVPATLHLRRAATRPYDTQVDIWLDPARHHLPVRALLQVRPLPLVTEYLLEALSSP